MKKKLVKKKPTRHECVVAAMAEAYHGDSNNDVRRKRAILIYERSIHVLKIKELQEELSSVRTRVKDIDSEIEGLTLVLEKR